MESIDSVSSQADQPVAARSDASGHLSLRDLSRAVRTRQWAKNVLIFAGFVFAGRLRAPMPVLWAELSRVLLAFLCFCALSGFAYLINDWVDVEKDRLHPAKQHRPLASGRMTKQTASALMVLLFATAVLSAFTVWKLEPAAIGFPVAAVLYLVLTLAYSAFLKHEVIVDVLCIAAGFVLRVAAGCLAIPVRISEWIIFCTFTLALFIALCKRRAELVEMGEQSADTRRVLPLYTVPMLDTFISIAAGLTITAYSLYTFTASHTAVLGSVESSAPFPFLMTTIPFVVYGIFRYLLLAHSSEVGGEPEQMLRDRPLVMNVVVWALLVAALTMLARL